MTELSYPGRPAPGFKDDSLFQAGEVLPIVEPNGVVVGQASRQYCHGGSKLLHPVVHLHIVNRFGDVYLQRRGADKDLYPLWWDTAVGGHVSYGEQIEEALFREASEELGFYDFNPQHVKTYVFESGTERELVSVFAAVGNFTPKPDNYEVAEGRYWTMKELEANIGRGVLTPNFEQEFTMIKDSLLSLL